MRTTAGLWCLLAVTAATADEPISGLRPGDQVSAWEPIHVAWPHAGTKTCPVCTYLDAPVLLVFARNVDAAEKLARPLETIAADHRSGKLKVMLVVVDGTDEQLRKLAKDAAIQAVMLVRPDPERKEKQLKAYKIDAAATNTVLLYQDYTVKNVWTGVKTADLADVKSTTDKYLPK
jgi:hypothetical protein